MLTLPILRTSSPINWGASINAGRVGWWLNLPHGQWGRGTRFHSLIGKYDGTWNGTAGWVGPRGRPGGYGSVDFDGASYIDLGAAIIPTGDFSLAAWVKVPSLSTYHDIFHQYAGGQSGRTVVYINQTTGKISYFNNGSDGQSTGAVVAGVWSRVLVTRLGDAVTFYLNGVAAGTAVNPNATYTGANTLLGGTLDPATAQMDDFSIWNRVLSADEAVADYKGSFRGYQRELNWLRVPVSVPAGGAPAASRPNLLLMGVG